jgi:hypothetical protein
VGGRTPAIGPADGACSRFHLSIVIGSWALLAVIVDLFQTVLHAITTTTLDQQSSPNARDVDNEIGVSRDLQVGPELIKIKWAPPPRILVRAFNEPTLPPKLLVGILIGSSPSARNVTVTYRAVPGKRCPRGRRRAGPMMVECDGSSMRGAQSWPVQMERPVRRTHIPTRASTSASIECLTLAVA